MIGVFHYIPSITNSQRTVTRYSGTLAYFRLQFVRRPLLLHIKKIKPENDIRFLLTFTSLIKLSKRKQEFQIHFRQSKLHLQVIICKENLITLNLHHQSKIQYHESTSQDFDVGPLFHPPWRIVTFSNCLQKKQ